MSTGKAMRNGLILAVAMVTAVPVAAQVLPSPPPVEPGQANLFFDYFLFDNAGQPAQNFNTFFLWNVTGGSVDLLGNGLLTPPTTGALPVNLEGRFVDLGGSTSNPGFFQTRRSFAVTTLDTYRLRFRYRSTGGGPETASVFLGDRRFDVSSASTDFVLFDQTFQFTNLDILNLAGLVTLGFQGSEANTDNTGIGIDSVLFDQVLPGAPGTPGGGIGVGAVPEPATWATLMLGFGIIGGAARYRRRKTIVSFG